MSHGEKKAAANLLKYFTEVLVKNRTVENLLRVKKNVEMFSENIQSKAVLASQNTSDVKKTNSISLSDIPKLIEHLTASPKKKEPVPRSWKKRKTPNMVEICRRTDHILETLRNHGGLTSQLNWRFEVLLNHLHEHPGVNEYAVKRGAIGIVLAIRDSLRREWLINHDQSQEELIEVTLAALGYAYPPRSSGIRILSIDGGGMRGLAVLRMLENIETITGQRIHELFDFICGVSTGAIITCALVPPNQMSIEEIRDVYMNISKKVFNQSAIKGTSQLFWSHAYYDTALWEKFLKDYLGNLSLLDTNKNTSCPKIAVISTVVNKLHVEPFIFRNYGSPCYKKSEYQGSYRYTLFDAVRASAAAPTLFQEFRTGDILHQDGGLVTNNPTAIALHEARSLWPKESIRCIVSLGTGKYDPGNNEENQVSESSKMTSWQETLKNIIQSATDTEAVHRMLNDLVSDEVYFRLNPHLSEPVSLDETDSAKLKLLLEDTNMYCRRNEDRFFDIAGKIKGPRSVVQKKVDRVQEYLRMLRFMQ